MNTKLACITALAALILSSPAEARHKHHHSTPQQAQRLDPGCNKIFPCDLGAASNNPFSGARSLSVTLHRVGRKASLQPSKARETAFYPAEGVIGGRPAGCPSAYCGCEASLHLFGKIIPSLNLAANWRKFPPASPAPRMAGWRSHHVLVLIAQVEGSLWLVHDGNSGGHLTRNHVRSIAGYNIVNPFSSRYADARW